MLEKVFLQILNMSFTSGIVILLVLAVRLLLRKAPKIYSYALWGVALFRLVCPFSLESVLSLLPAKANPISQDIVYAAVPRIDTGIAIINDTINPALPLATPHASVNPLQIWISVGSIIWLAGITALLIYSIFTLVRLQRRLRSAEHLRDNIYLCKSLDTAFVLGILNPKIYLPADLPEVEQEYILLHEQTHIRRFDHVVRIAGFLVLCLHWFNPLVWAAFFISGRDMEMACDEAVIGKLGYEVKKEYSTSLLSLSTGKRIVGGTPLAFGEGDTKSRVKNVLNFKNPRFWVSALAVVVVICATVSLMTNPKEEIEGYAEGLWKHRTQYIGDASAVSALVGELEFPDGVSYDGIELHTAEPPYALTVKLKTDTETRNYYTGADNEAPFQVNACILFSLIENAGYINFELDDGISDPYFMQYTADWAHNKVGVNLWEESQMLERFEALLEKIMSASGEPAAKPRIYFDNLSAEDEALYQRLTQERGLEEWQIHSLTSMGLDFQSILNLPEGEAAAMLAPGSGFMGDRMTEQEFYGLVESGIPENDVYVLQSLGYDYNGVLALTPAQRDFILPNTELVDNLVALGYDRSIVAAAGFLHLGGWETYKDLLDAVFATHFDGLGGEQELIDPLELAISAAILDREKDNSDSEFVCESHVTLSTEARSPADNSDNIDMVTVYAMVLIQKYNFVNDGLDEVGGSHIPTAITFDVSESGEYTLKEYWIPRDGSYYGSDIKEKFPSAIWEDALDTQKYILAQIQNCYAQAINYKQLDTVPIIENLFDTLMSSPSGSSNPDNYINAHRLEYRELTYYGDYTLRYIFSEFLKGGQTGLKGRLMWIVMDDLIAGEGMPMAAESGQEYFDAWREHGQKKLSSIREEEMRENYPKSYLMLTMLPEGD